MARSVTRRQRAQLEPLLRRTGMPDVDEYFQALTGPDVDWLITELSYPQFRKHDGDWTVIGPPSAVKRGTVTVHKKGGTQTTVQVKRVSKPFPHAGRQMVRGFLK